MNELIVDVRSREEFLKHHVKGAINIPHFDLELYGQLLNSLGDNADIAVYCTTEYRAGIAENKLRAMGITARIIRKAELKNMEWEGSDVVCAVNYVRVRPGHENDFERSVKQLCRSTDDYPGFLGSHLLRVSGVSAIGSGLPGEMKALEIKPVKYIILTYWVSKEVHDKSHLGEVFQKAFKEMPQYLVSMPYEEFYEILR